MRKTVINILTFALIAVGCQQKKQSETNIANINETKISDFDLNSDYADFKTEMTDLDTLKVWINHSVCTFEGYERLLITKNSDSIKIMSEFKDYDEPKPKWEKIFEKSITDKDTIWNFDDFLEQNKSRISFDDDEYATIEIASGEQKLKFVTKGLVDLNTFIADYGKTMLSLHEPKEKQIYGVPVVIETELLIDK